jgi:hypothetical protein
VLAVVLVFGGFGAPVAAADTETEGSVSDTHGLGEQDGEADTTQTETVSPTEPGIVDTLPPLLGGLDGGTLFGSQHGETANEGTQTEETAREGSGEESVVPAGPMSIGVTAENDPPAAATVTEQNKGSDTVPADATEVVTEPLVPAAAVSSSSAADPTPVPETPAAEALPPAVDPPAAQPTAVQPVAAEVAQAENAPAPVQAENVALIGSAAPANDIVTALAYLFIALTDDSVPFISIPEGLLSLLGFSGMGEGTTAAVNAGGIGGSFLAGGAYSAVRKQLASSGALQADWPEMLVALRESGGLSSSGVVHPTPGGVGASGMAEQRSVGLKAVLADGLVPENVQSAFQHTVDAFLAPLSFVVLAALASPGLTGLMLLSAAGMFFGYRQARAASMLRAVNIARFVKSGPLGVVRSDSLVALHPRTSDAVADEQPRRTKRHLESVA